MTTDTFTAPETPRLAPEQVGLGRRYLEETRDGVVEAVGDLTPAQWRFRPAPDRWSIADVMEHLALLEELFHDRIVPRLRQGAAGLPDRDPERMDALVLAWEPDPASKVVIPGRVSLGEAPPPLQPTRLWNPAESVDRFHAQRAQTAALLDEFAVDGRLRAVDHPAIGPLDGYQWVLFLAAHSERHTRQIEGIRAHPRFPAVDSAQVRTTI